MHRVITAVAFAALLAAISPSAAQAGILYGADGSGGNPSTLYTINTSTGAATAIGSIGFAITGLAFDPTSGILYGGTSNAGSGPKGLVTINTSTGAGSLVGLYGVSGSMADITFDAAGTLYGWNEPGADDLHTINKTTGAATSVGEAGISTATAGLAFDNTGTLYLESIGTLYTINPVTGAVVTSVNPGFFTIGLGLAFDENNVLFGLERVAFSTTVRNLITIDTTTGAYTVIGQTTDRMDALAFAPQNEVPEPAALTLFGLGGLGLAAVRRRRNA